jgi:hypothetical protein
VLCLAAADPARRAAATRISAAASASAPGAAPGSRSVRIATVPLRPGHAFSTLEGLITSTFNSSQTGARLDWQEVEGCWVLYPPEGVETEAVVHFLGGAFVGERQAGRGGGRERACPAGAPPPSHVTDSRHERSWRRSLGAALAARAPLLLLALAPRPRPGRAAPPHAAAPQAPSRSSRTASFWRRSPRAACSLWPRPTAPPLTSCVSPRRSKQPGWPAWPACRPNAA